MNAPSGSQCTFCAATAISVPARSCTATPSEAKGGQTAMSIPVNSSSRRLSSMQNSAVSAGPLYIFQLPAISIYVLRYRSHSRQFFPFQELEGSSAAGRGPVDLVDEPQFGQRADRIGAADDGVRVALRPLLQRTSCPRRSAATRRRPSGRSRTRSSRRRSSSQTPHASPARCRARANRREALRSEPPSTPRPRRTRPPRRRRSAARPERRAGSRRAPVRPSCRRSARGRPGRQVLEHAELVLDLRAAGDEHERPLDLAEQFA